MGNIRKVGARNKIEVPGRKYSISELISESYQTLYNCDLDSKLYKLTESHITDLQQHPSDIQRLSHNLEILKGLSRLGESAKIKESDLAELDDEDVINENEDFYDDDEELEEDEDFEFEDEELEEEEFIEDEDEYLEEDEMLDEPEDEEEFIEEDEDFEYEDDEEFIEEDEEYEDDEITPDELKELKAHLRRTRESKKAVQEGKSWITEQSSMTKALKNFRESSNKKAFMKSFSKLQERMKSDAPLTLEESLLLFKASNSAMTHLAVELEHNPDFIYTFRECTSILAQDNEALLECIRRQESPKKSLVESFRRFSNILLESEDLDLEDESIEEEEDVVISPEEEEEIQESEEEEVVAPEEALEESEDEEEVLPEPEDEELEESEEQEEIPSEEELEEEEVIEDEESEELEEDDLDPEISEEEAEELKRHLAEMRRNRRK